MSYRCRTTPPRRIDSAQQDSPAATRLFDRTASMVKRQNANIIRISEMLIVNSLLWIATPAGTMAMLFAGALLVSLDVSIDTILKVFILLNMRFEFCPCRDV